MRFHSSCRSLCLFRHSRVPSFGPRCKSRVIRVVEANESVVKRLSERLCAWSRGRFAGIDPCYGSPRFSPEAPRCRQTIVGIRNAIALLNQDLWSRREELQGIVERFAAFTMRDGMGRDGEFNARERIAPIELPGDIPFRLLQNARTDNGIPYMESTTIHLCHTFVTLGLTSFA